MSLGGGGFRRRSVGDCCEPTITDGSHLTVGLWRRANDDEEQEAADATDETVLFSTPIVEEVASPRASCSFCSCGGVEGDPTSVAVQGRTDSSLPVVRTKTVTEEHVTIPGAALCCCDGWPPLPAGAPDDNDEDEGS